MKKNIQEACWKGYKSKGMKKKNGRMVPNCVPVSENTIMKNSIYYTKIFQIISEESRSERLLRTLPGHIETAESKLKNTGLKHLQPKDKVAALQARLAREKEKAEKRALSLELRYQRRGESLEEGKLCAKGKSAAKRKYDVYPSAYANMYASAVCSGKVKSKGKKK